MIYKPQNSFDYVGTYFIGRLGVLHNVHIGKHSMAGAYFQHEEKRPRLLLVHKEQARKSVSW
jgi:tmRNA-binding protein